MDHPKDTEKDSEYEAKDPHSEEIGIIHEMLKEALMVSNSNHPQLESGYTDAPPFSDHPPTYLNYQNHDPLTIGKLYLQFTNLDIRLKRVEEVIFPDEHNGGSSLLSTNRKFGKKRAAPQNRSLHPGDTFLLTSGEQDSAMKADTNSSSSPLQIHLNRSQMNSINPIWSTGSSDVLSIESIQGPFASMRSSSTSSISSKFISTEDIKRSELDHFCLPLLEVNPKPSVEELQEIVNLIKPVYSSASNKQLLSKVREWFRKRREYMSQRIFQTCSDLFKNVQIRSEQELNQQIDQVQQNPRLIERILNTSDLEITDAEVAKNYCMEKISSFFNGLYRQKSARNRLQ